MKCLVNFDLELYLKFEISDEKNPVKFWRRAFLPDRKARDQANFGAIFGNFVSNFTTFFRKLRSAEGRR